MHNQAKLAFLTALLLTFTPLVAQTTPPAARPAVRPARPAAYPERPPADPAVVDRGKALYGVNCNFCHGSDARGGEGGPNLLRSEMVLNDKAGEGIAQVVQNGRPDQGMPKFPLTLVQISDIAAYIHSFKVGGYDVSRMTPLSILVGNAKAGQAYFQSRCASCHSVTGDLKGIATRIEDPKVLQNYWLNPGLGRGGGPRGQGGARPATVTVTMGNGQKVEGRLGRIDDFTVAVIAQDGSQRTIRRESETTPKVEIHDPLQPHKDLMPTYTDTDIHNLTSYLVTVK